MIDDSDGRYGPWVFVALIVAVIIAALLPTCGCAAAPIDLDPMVQAAAAAVTTRIETGDVDLGEDSVTSWILAISLGLGSVGAAYPAGRVLTRTWRPFRR